jgi:hypothetical protein
MFGTHHGLPKMLGLGIPMLTALAALLMLPHQAVATPSYADATGQRCATCHVGQPGQAVLTDQGQRFAAIATHRTDPAGAWAVVVGSGAAGAPVQIPSQLPRTGEVSAPILGRWAPGIGAILIAFGGALAAVGRRRGG